MKSRAGGGLAGGQEAVKQGAERQVGSEIVEQRAVDNLHLVGT